MKAFFFTFFVTVIPFSMSSLFISLPFKYVVVSKSCQTKWNRYFVFHIVSIRKFVVSTYRESSGYDGLDLRCFEVTNAPHKNVKNDVE